MCAQCALVHLKIGHIQATFRGHGSQDRCAYFGDKIDGGFILRDGRPVRTHLAQLLSRNRTSPHGPVDVLKHVIDVVFVFQCGLRVVVVQVPQRCPLQRVLVPFLYVAPVVVGAFELFGAHRAGECLAAASPWFVRLVAHDASSRSTSVMVHLGLYVREQPKMLANVICMSYMFGKHAFQILANMPFLQRIAFVFFKQRQFFLWRLFVLINGELPLANENTQIRGMGKQGKKADKGKAKQVKARQGNDPQPVLIDEKKLQRWSLKYKDSTDEEKIKRQDEIQGQIWNAEPGGQQARDLQAELTFLTNSMIDDAPKKRRSDHDAGKSCL